MHIYYSRLQIITTFSTTQLTFLFQRMMNNKSSLFMHVYIVKSGRSPDPGDAENYVIHETIKKTKRECYYDEVLL